MRRRAIAGERRRALIEAVFECVVEWGVNETTTAAIARAAGLSKGIIHYYFRDKLELFEAAFATTLEDQLRFWRRRISPAEPAGRQLFQMVLAALPRSEEGRKRSRFWFQFMASALVEPGLMELHQRYDGMVRAFVREQIERLQATGALPRSRDAEATALGIVCFANGLGLSLVSNPTYPIDAVERAIRDFTAGLLQEGPDRTAEV